MKEKTGVLWLLIAIIVISAFAFAACNGNREFVVTFDENGGILVSGQEVQAVKSGQSVNPPVYEKEGYTLSWDVAFDNIMSNITVTAVWTPIKYTYIFKNWDSIELKTETADYGSPITPPATPTKAATFEHTFAFTGWSPTIPDTLTGNIIFTAQYSPAVKQCTYTFLNWDGVELKTEIADYGSPITPPAAPAKTATTQYTYTFSGWDKEIPMAITENITFTATYSQSVRQYTVTFESNGGSATNPITTLYNTPVSAPTDPTKETYAFAGWYTDSECTEKYNFETPLTADIMLYAKWDMGSKGLVYTPIKDGAEYSVTGYSDYYDMNVHIPAIYNGKPVTSIGAKAFYGYWPLTGVVIPESITSIGAEAFYGCQKIKSMIIPQNVTSIGDGAFNSAGLASVTMPEGLISIGGYAFYNCTGLIIVIIPNSVNSLGDSAFYWCTRLASVTLSSQLTLIEDRTFYHCTSLTSIVIPQGVTSIGDSAFSMCESLTGVNFSARLTSIGTWAFYYCTSLTSIEIPSNITSISERAFYDCSALKSVTVSALTPPVSELDVFTGAHTSLLIHVPTYSLAAYKMAENWSDYAVIIVPFTVTATYQTNGGGVIDAVTVPYNTAISAPVDPAKASYTFAGWYLDSACTEAYDFGTLLNQNVMLYAKWQEGSAGLVYTLVNEGAEYSIAGYSGSDTEVCIPAIYNGKNVTAIGANAFKDQWMFTSAIIPSSVTSVGEGAFSGCTGLVSLVMPSSVTSLGDSAFRWCTSLTDITLSQGLTYIGQETFYNCRSLAGIIIPSGVIGIGYSAFGLCMGLTSVVIPDSVQNVGNYAFYNCEKLASIEMPSGMNIIGMNAFFGCSKLKSVTVSAIVPPTLGGGAFADTHTSLMIYVPSSSLAAYKTAESWSVYEAIIVPSTVTATFDTDGGSAVVPETIPYNGELCPPTVPTKNGFVFDGWYSDINCTAVYDFAALVTGDFTLYAKWVKGTEGLEYKIVNGGTEYE